MDGSGLNFIVKSDRFRRMLEQSGTSLSERVVEGCTVSVGARTMEAPADVQVGLLLSGSVGKGEGETDRRAVSRCW